jgi:hypothetical protein
MTVRRRLTPDTISADLAPLWRGLLFVLTAIGISVRGKKPVRVGRSTDGHLAGLTVPAVALFRCAIIVHLISASVSNGAFGNADLCGDGLFDASGFDAIAFAAASIALTCRYPTPQSHAASAKCWRLRAPTWLHPCCDGNAPTLRKTSQLLLPKNPLLARCGSIVLLSCSRSCLGRIPPNS